jgi:hypothetical protein
MYSLKFLSLVVLCAASTMMLVLPATGLVPFPKQMIETTPPTAQAVPPTIATGWQPSSNMPPNALGLPISTTIQNQSGPPSLSQLPAEVGSLDPSARRDYDKWGLGLWLLLIPIWLLSLFVWSITGTKASGR